MSRVAFVTGGAGGIGAAVCRQLAADGHHVVVADLDEEQAGKVAAEIGGVGVGLDVTDLASIRSAVAFAVSEFGPVEICVNVAGFGRETPLASMRDEDIEALLAVNLLGVIRVVREVAGPMTAAGWGRIVNVSSGSANGTAGYSVYGAAKAGVNTFSKAIAAEVGRAGVTVNVMSPGAIQTPLLVSAYGENYEQALAAVTRSIPMGRIGEPEEAAAVVRFLVSEEASYVSAQVVQVNGGGG